MSTPMRHAHSQQGKTPSQSQHGAVATPPVSTPFSAAHAAFSPHGPKSSPQQVKKSPATTATLGHSSNAAVNFDSPSAAAAFGALNLGAGLDLNLENVNVGALGGLGSLGRSNEDERAKRLEDVISILNRSKGVVSEEGLERLVKRIGLECIWENDMDVESKKTLIVAGSALELLIVLSSHIVQSVSLTFPDSAESINRHAAKAGEILFEDLKLSPNQSPLTKRLDQFAANFERLAILDKLSTNPGLNLFEAVAGVYESLERLYQWEMQKAREDAIFNGKGEGYLENVVLCTKSGLPAMNTRGRVGLSLDYWKERHLWKAPTAQQQIEFVARSEQTWALLVGCSPLRDLGTAPVRLSDKWISADVEKMPGLLDWQEPENTLLPSPDHEKDGAGADSMTADPTLLGPRLPEVAFLATFDPPIHVYSGLWQELRQMGIGLTTPDIQMSVTFDNLLFPVPQGSSYDPSETRVISRHKKVEFRPPTVPGEPLHWTAKKHSNTLYIYKPSYGKTLSEVTFSHPRHLVNMLPFLRQYAFLSTVLHNSFGDKPEPPEPPKIDASTTTTKTTTNQDDFAAFMAHANDESHTPNATVNGGTEKPLKVDVTLNVQPAPRLQIVFPFRSATATINLEIRENGQVHVESQNVLDESNSVGPDGKRRRPEDIGKLLETCEDVGKVCEYIRSRWG